jgi:hypothetical protein
MKKYLLTAFGDFEEKDVVTFAENLQPIIDSEHLKFQYRDGVIILHFGSDFSLSDIHEFIQMTDDVEQLLDMFILSEVNDSTSIYIKDGMDKHLLDLDNETEDVINFDLVPKNRMDNYYDEDNEDDIVTVLLNEVKKNLQLPTLDQLLDKVSEHGVESLTPYEKATLDNYSQK